MELMYRAQQYDLITVYGYENMRTESRSLLLKSRAQEPGSDPGQDSMPLCLLVGSSALRTLSLLEQHGASQTTKGGLNLTFKLCSGSRWEHSDQGRKRSWEPQAESDCTAARNDSPENPEHLQTSGSNIQCDENTGVTGPGTSNDPVESPTSLTSEWRMPWSSSSVVVAFTWEAWWHCENHDFRFLQCLQHHPKRTDIEHQLAVWILDHLTNTVCGTVICSSGATDTTVLPPFLFTHYTWDFWHNNPKCALQMFSDNFTIVGFISDDDNTE